MIHMKSQDLFSMKNENIICYNFLCAQRVKQATILLQEPLSRVILLLDLLRTFSHFDSNMPTMIRHQVPATILGCMTVHYDVVEVQSYGLDALARIAKFKLVIDKKVSSVYGLKKICFQGMLQQ